MCFKNYFFLVFCFFKLEAADFSRFDITIPEIKEAHAWIQSPQSLSWEMADLHSETLRIIKIMNQSTCNAGIALGYSEKKILGQSFFEIIDLFEKLSGSDNKAYNFVNLCQLIERSINIRIANTEELIRLSQQLDRQGELVASFKQSLDYLHLLNEIRVYVTENILIKLPPAVQKLFSEMHKINTVEHYQNAMFNSFVLGTTTFNKKILRLAKNKIREVPRIKEQQKSVFQNETLQWMLLPENSSTVLEAHLSVCRFIEYFIGKGWIEYTPPAAPIGATTTEKVVEKKRKPSKKTKETISVTSSSTIEPNEGMLDADEDEIEEKSKQSQMDRLPTVAAVLADSERTVATEYIFPAASADVCTDEVTSSIFSKEAASASAGSGASERVVAFSPHEQLLNWVASLQPTSWLNAKDISYIGEIFDTVGGLVGSSDVAAFLKRLVAKQGGSAEYKESGGSHKLAVLTLVRD